MDQVTFEIDLEAVRKNEIITYLNCFKESNDEFDCMVAGSKSTLATKSGAIKHLKRLHAEIYDEIDAKKSTQTNRKSEVKITETPA